jgi:diacylglycerol kinase (ATP)
VGKVTLPDKVEYFANIGDAGLGGFTVETANRWQLPIPGHLIYLAASAWGLVKYSGSPMTLTWDDGGKLEGRFVVLAIANCPFFGGGMHIAPGAQPDDGLFDVVACEARGPWYMFKNLKRLYDGSLLTLPGVHHWRCKKITMASDGPIPMDLDGEWAEGIPVTFECLPGALPFHRP